jgi:glutaredoxin 3
MCALSGAAGGAALNPAFSVPPLALFRSYCAKAKSALSPLVSGKALVWHELDHMDNGSEIQAALAFTGATSVPRVFVGGKFIGGGDDTAALARSGELKRMIDAARA